MSPRPSSISVWILVLLSKPARWIRRIGAISPTSWRWKTYWVLGTRYALGNGVHRLRLGMLIDDFPAWAYHSRGVCKSYVASDLYWFGIIHSIHRVSLLNYTERRRKGRISWPYQDKWSRSCYKAAHQEEDQKHYSEYIKTKISKTQVGDYWIRNIAGTWMKELESWPFHLFLEICRIQKLEQSSARNLQSSIAGLVDQTGVRTSPVLRIPARVIRALIYLTLQWQTHCHHNHI